MNVSFYLQAIARASFLTVLILAFAKAEADEPTLCSLHEEVYFSCLIGGRVMSVCASGNISPNNGYVQYRFGRIGKIELEFPEKPYPPRKSFSISDISEGNSRFTHFKFNSGRYNYVLYQGSPSGIYVKKDGKVVSNRSCDPGTDGPINPRAFRGIKTVEPIDGIDN